MKGKLSIVGTPIGNLGDISTRAVNNLKDSDIIAAEDTRVSLKLLNGFKIKKTLISYREQNKKEAGVKILNLLNDGKNVSLITDAGMPCISDPGVELVSLVRKNNIEIEIIPGPCALISAISGSGLNCSEFIFLGFLPAEENIKIKKLANLKNLSYSMVLYEAPHRLVKTLTAILKILGDRKVVIAKELTKKHETYFAGILSETINYYNTYPPKGEFVIIIEGKEQEEDLSLENATEFAKELISKGIKATDAAKTAADFSKSSKSEIYNNIIKNG